MPIDLAAEAVLVAEEGLADLPTSPRVRDLHRRVAALKSVLRGVAREVLRPHHRRIASDAVRLAGEVLDCHRRRYFA
jgi:hypothetical protein